jgi:HAD superfamily hydrolase (TIGR01549 family)
VSGGAAGPLAILDVDGTLVDTNYHHALAWFRALRRHDRRVPLWRLHRHMGMGGDQLVAAVTDDAFEADRGDDVRDAEKEEYGRLIDEVVALEGASELIEALRDHGCRVVLSSSAKQEEVEHYVELLGAGDVPYTTSADVENTKPEPDLIEAALEKGGGGDAFLIGDSTWDCEAAGGAGVRTVAVLTGGFSEQELLDAGAERVFRDIEALLAVLDDVIGSPTAAR